VVAEQQTYPHVKICAHTAAIPVTHAVPTQDRAGRPWDGGACPVGLETRQPDLQEWYRLNRTLHKKRIVSGGHWATLFVS
jgi:hypothetical protein